MDGASRSRLVSAFAALVVLWIVVFWAWQPRSAGVTFANGAGPNTIEELPFEEGPAPIDALDAGAAQDAPPSDEGSPVREAPIEEPARPAPEPTSGVIPPEFRDYVVKDGDTFAIIARKMYGDASRAGAIARANPYKDPRRLKAGQVIRVPLDPDNVQGVPVGDGKNARVDAGPREYVVQKGDTLGSIARAQYGSIRYADSIFEANRATLKSRNSIRVGQKLVLPPHPERGS